MGWYPLLPSTGCHAHIAVPVDRVTRPGIDRSSRPSQRQVPKIGNICPMGYVDMLNGKCSTLGLMTYTVQPTNGEACPTGWMNVGGNYCRKK